MATDDSREEEGLSVEAIKRQLELLATPVDFDQLCRDGILERVGKKKFKVLDGRRLPEAAATRILTIGPNGVTFEDTVKRSRMLLRSFHVEPARPTMERFIPTGDAERDDPQIAACKSNPEWKYIYSFLHWGYWHVTNPTAWAAIRKCGVIRPNANEPSRTRWGEHLTSRSFAHVHKYVALFDFISPNEREVISQWGNAWDVLTNQGAATILIRLDRRRLRSKIIPNCEGRKIVDDKAFGCIPFCEVWYPAEIPTAAITGVYEVPPPSGFEFKPRPIRKTW